MKSPYALIAVFLLILLIMGAGGELYLRHKIPYYDDTLKMPAAQPDNVLGWINRQAAGEFRSFSGNRSTISITQTADGRRATSRPADRNAGKRDQIVIVGGSLTYGYGLSDEETWPWLLQQQTPCAAVLNYGAPGYGTVQSLLMLERVLPQLPAPRIVIYGFLEHHLVRNVAPPAWQAVLAMNRGGNVLLPYVDINDNNRLVRYPPVPVKQWPLSRSLAMVKFAEIMYLKRFQSPEPFTKMDAAWQLLMVEMRDLCARHGCRLVVLMYNLTHHDQKAFYLKFLEINHIDFIDGDIDMPPERMLDKDPSHPNHKANAIWADIVHRHIFCRDGKPVDVFDGPGTSPEKDRL